MPGDFMPCRVWKKLGVKKASTIAFVETADGKIEVRALEAEALAALDEIEAALNEKGVTLEQLMASGKRHRQRLLKVL